jgi:raffinose/stachyose/melibiose transport system substrate-binding protein
VTIQLWYWSILRPDLGTDQYRTLIDDWNAERTDIHIEATAYDMEEYRSKIKTSLAAGEAPDMFYMWSGSFVRPYLRTGNMLPIDTYLTGDVKARIKPGMLEACMDGGKTYSVPIYTFIANLYCNTELFEQAGAVIPKTYDELLAAVKALRGHGITPIALGEKDRWPGMYWYNILAMRHAGLQGASQALQYPALFERAAFREAAEKLLELHENDAFSENAFEMGFVDMLDSFRNGEAAMMYQGDWVAATIEDEGSPTKDAVTLVPFPVVPGGDGSAYEFLGGNIDSYYIRADTEHPDEAVEVLLDLSERAGKEGQAAGLGISCWKIAADESGQTPPLAAQSVALMETGRGYLGWWDTILPATSAETHKSLVADLLDGRVTPEEFTMEMAKLVGSQP